MSFDYTSADRFLELIFSKLNKAPLSFPEKASLSELMSKLLEQDGGAAPVIPHPRSFLFASASVEMWQRAVHSFLWSVALTDRSPIWASVSGYYASHFVMRAFAHSFGFFKSFTKRKVTQVVLQGGQFVCSLLPARDRGEHSFYWKAVKDHPSFSRNPLFHQNSERDPFSDCTHRNFANYTDHIDFFGAVEFPDIEDIATATEKIRRIRRHSVTQPCRDDYPDLFNVQILAYQRIVTYREYMDARIHGNRFWNAHRDPAWCKGILHFQLEDQPLDAVGA